MLLTFPYVTTGPLDCINGYWPYTGCYKYCGFVINPVYWIGIAWLTATGWIYEEAGTHPTYG